MGNDWKNQELVRDRLKKLIERKAWGFKELMRQSSINELTLSKFVNGKDVRMDTLFRLKKFIDDQEIDHIKNRKSIYDGI